MRHLIFTLLLTLTLPIIASAANDNPTSPIVEVQNRNPKKPTDANVYGHIVSANSGEHLPYATVAIKGTTIGCAADGTGHYKLNNLPLGEVTFVVSAIGYETVEM